MKLLQILMMAKKGIDILINTCSGWTSNYRWNNVECDGDDLVLSKGEPDDISGLNLWLKADELDLDDNDTVATWADSSGNENDATQTTSSYGPIFKTNVLNGKPVVRFDGSNDWLSIGNDVFDGISSEVSVFIVASSASATKNTSCFVALPDDTGNRFNCHLPWGGGTLYWDFGDIGSNGRISKDWGGTTNTHYIWTLLAGSGMQIKRDGTSLETSANSSTFTPGTKTLRFGYYNGSVYWGGDIAEIIIYNKRLSTDEIAQVEGYLSAKYDIAEIDEPGYVSQGERVSTPLLIPSHTTSNIQWEKETDEDTDVKIYTGISDSDDEEPSLITGYSYRKKITINGESGAGTNYQILLKIGESSGSTDDDFHLEGNSEDFPSEKNDGGDLTFSGSDGKTELAFWVEKVSGATPDRTAWVWVKVKEDLGTDKYIYIYYGNDSAENKSDGENTFILFDDFDGDSLDTNKWETNDIGDGSRSFSNSVMTQSVTSGGTRKILPKSNSFGRISMEMLHKNNGARRSLEDYNIIKDSQNSFQLFYENAAVIGISTDFLNNNSWQGIHVMEGSSSANVWRIVTINNKGNTSVAGIYDIDRVSKGSDTRNFDLGSSVSLGSFGCRYINANATVEIDWFFIRKIISTEPSFKEAGTEYPTYTEATNDSTIPDLVANKYLYCKQVLSTKDTSKTPKLKNLKIEIK